MCGQLANHGQQFWGCRISQAWDLERRKLAPAMTFSIAAQRVLQARRRPNAVGQLAKLIQARSHHPDPFNPKTTRGWKAALAVRDFVSWLDSWMDGWRDRCMCIDMDMAIYMWNHAVMYMICNDSHPNHALKGVMSCIVWIMKSPC
jgi:hypothetical protein